MLFNRHLVRFEASFGEPRQLPPSDCGEIAFAGRSNVGKSSMINKLFNQKHLARTSSMPGKTVTVNFYRLESVRFADLPGYGYAKASKEGQRRWSRLAEHYFQSGRDIRLVLMLLDIRHVPTENDMGMLAFLDAHEIPYVLVLTKSDKLTVRQRETQCAEFTAQFGDEVTMIPFSTVTGAGVEEVWAIIEQAVDAQ